MGAQDCNFAGIIDTNHWGLNVHVLEILQVRTKNIANHIMLRLEVIKTIKKNTPSSLKRAMRGKLISVILEMLMHIYFNSVILVYCVS